MGAVKLQCPAEQHERILQASAARCFCPYCGLELRSVCSPKVHEQRAVSGDLFCITCGTALTAESTARKELEQQEVKKRCAENNHAGVSTVRITEDNKIECSVCDGRVSTLAQFVSQ